MSEPSSRSELLQAQVRTYFEACNEGDYDKMARVLAPDVIHYFPPGMFGPCIGSRAIADLWRGLIRQAGSRWTIDRMLCDGNEAVTEWTHWQPKSNSWIRGAEWYEFDAAGLITVIKAYYASPRDQSLHANELGEYPYEQLGYAMSPPSVAPELTDEDGVNSA